jgi:hypothetical protein
MDIRQKRKMSMFKDVTKFKIFNQLTMVIKLCLNPKNECSSNFEIRGLVIQEKVEEQIVEVLFSGLRATNPFMERSPEVAETPSKECWFTSRVPPCIVFFPFKSELCHNSSNMKSFTMMCGGSKRSMMFPQRWEPVDSS